MGEVLGLGRVRVRVRVRVGVRVRCSVVTRGHTGLGLGFMCF